jgi:hypothetical protein
MDAVVVVGAYEKGCCIYTATLTCPEGFEH